MLHSRYEPVSDKVDVVEVNRIVDSKGHVTLEQVIWWNYRYDAYQVVAWRFAGFVGLPEKRGQRWVSRWFDGKKIREVVARVNRETWTMFDPELADRHKLPESWRIGLRGERLVR